jgi:hypothetical protein
MAMARGQNPLREILALALVLTEVRCYRKATESAPFPVIWCHPLSTWLDDGCKLNPIVVLDNVRARNAFGARPQTKLASPVVHAILEGV